MSCSPSNNIIDPLLLQHTPDISEVNAPEQLNAYEENEVELQAIVLEGGEQHQ
jgi:hypothetical protein